eukprot:g29015.t1
MKWRAAITSLTLNFILNIAFISSSVCRQYLNITQHHCLFTKNVALKDYHRKAFTDVVLDVILTELSEHVDKDLADLFRYERQMEETDLITDS